MWGRGFSAENKDRTHYFFFFLGGGGDYLIRGVLYLTKGKGTIYDSLRYSSLQRVNQCVYYTCCSDSVDMYIIYPCNNVNNFVLIFETHTHSKLKSALPWR